MPQPIMLVSDMENDSDYGTIALRYAGEDRSEFDAWINDLKSMSVYDAWRGGITPCYIVRTYPTSGEFLCDGITEGCPIVTINRLPGFKSSVAIFRNLHRRIWGKDWDRTYEDGHEFLLEIKPKKPRKTA